MNITYLLEKFCQESHYFSGRSPDTIKRYRANITFFIQQQNIIKIDAVNRQQIMSFFAFGRSERGWKPATYRTYYMSLKVFFRWCVKEKYLKENPILGLDLPKLDAPIPKGLSLEKATALLDWAYHMPSESRIQRIRNQALFATFIYAGLRKSELLNLKLGDIDLIGDTIFVSKGKGRKDRLVPICMNLKEILSRYLFERNKAKKNTIYFFTSTKQDRAFTKAGLKHLTKKIKQHANISFTIHGLRHTFATLMIEGGCDIYSLSKMMGHSNIKTTTIYLSASVEHLRGQIAKHPLDVHTTWS